MTFTQSPAAGSLAGHAQRETHRSGPVIPRVAIGIVTYNNEPSQLRRLLHSIDRAAARLDPASFGAAVVAIDCGSPSEWCARDCRSGGSNIGATWASAAG